MLSPNPLARRVFGILILALAATSTGDAQRRSTFARSDSECSRSWGDRDTERVCSTRDVTIPATSLLRVDGRTNGGITVTGTSRRDVLIIAKIQTSARSEARAEELAEEIRIHTEGGKIYAEGPDTRNRESWSVSFEIEVPAESDLDLRAGNGGLSVLGVTGTLRMETQNGGIHLESVGGDVIAETTNGGVQVDLDGDRWRGKGLEAITANGGVRVNVPRDYSAHLETGTVNGSVDIDFPVMVQGRIGRRISTDLGRGGPTVRVTTTNGTVAIRRNR
ncbi:MAG: DUF4097 family beta strand repeat protein [Gemmatimonadales bacterium]|nr:DUF4097 family beta strand repeat protein [Gemmatimonadales bacterium]